MPEMVKAAWIPYGRTLRQLRTQSRMSCRALASSAACAESLISKIERGLRGVSEQMSQTLGQALEAQVPHAAKRLRSAYERAERASQYTWHTDIADVEVEATHMQIWEPLLVPGIHQTAAYAESVFRDGRPDASYTTIADLVATRMDRVRTAENKEIWSILDETSLYRRVGGPQVMAAQIRYLIDISSHRRKITVLPKDTPYCGGLAGSIILLGSPPSHQTAYAEHTSGGEIITDPDEIVRVSAIWRELSAWAQTPAESIETMKKALKVHESALEKD